MQNKLQILKEDKIVYILFFLKKNEFIHEVNVCFNDFSYVFSLQNSNKTNCINQNIDS